MGVITSRFIEFDLSLTYVVEVEWKSLEYKNVLYIVICSETRGYESRRAGRHGFIYRCIHRWLRQIKQEVICLNTKTHVGNNHSLECAGRSCEHLKTISE